MQVELVSPERITFSGEANAVIVRTVGGGDIEFMNGHVPFIGVLQVWQARVIGPEGEDVFAIHQGFVQMTGTKVTILSDVSENKEDIDVARATSALERAEAALSSDDSDEEALAAKHRAEVRLKVASGELLAS